jgi:hypothetical protein
MTGQRVTLSLFYSIADDGRPLAVCIRIFAGALWQTGEWLGFYSVAIERLSTPNVVRCYHFSKRVVNRKVFRARLDALRVVLRGSKSRNASNGLRVAQFTVLSLLFTVVGTTADAALVVSVCQLAVC